MDEDELSYKALRKIQQLEKNSPILTEVLPSFYEDLSIYLDGLNNRFNSESSSQKKMILEDEIENTKKIAISIYEHREKKILLAAVSKARGGNPDLKNLVEKEKILFDSVLDLMDQLRKQLLNQKKFIGKNAQYKNNKKEDSESLNPIVRIKENIPEFIGTDEKKYNLRNGDILSIPEDMSEMLSKRGVAEKIKR